MGILSGVTNIGTQTTFASARFDETWPPDNERFRDPETGLYVFEVPESEEEELARLREENRQLREALVEERAALLASAPYRHAPSPKGRDTARAELIAEGLLPPK